MMTASEKKLMIPFYKGAMMREEPYESCVEREPENFEHRENEVFFDFLGVEDYTRTRSAVFLTLHSFLDCKKYYMSIADYFKSLPDTHAGGVLRGYFCFTKRGSTYGLRLVKSTKEEVF